MRNINIRDEDYISFPTKQQFPPIGRKWITYLALNTGSFYRWDNIKYTESSPTLTAAEIKVLYESNLDTNAFSDAEKLKLSTLVLQSFEQWTWFDDPTYLYVTYWVDWDWEVERYTRDLVTQTSTWTGQIGVKPTTLAWVQALTYS